MKFNSLAFLGRIIIGILLIFIGYYISLNVLVNLPEIFSDNLPYLGREVVDGLSNIRFLGYLLIIFGLLILFFEIFITTKELRKKS
jgi:hypothetical protein